VHVDRGDLGGQASAQVDSGRLVQRRDRLAEHRAVGHHDRIVAAGEGRVEQPQRAHHTLDLDAAPLQAHALAHAERAGAEQHRAGEEVAQRLLGGEAEDDRGERAAEGERLRCDPRDAQRDEQADDHGDEPQEEADRPGSPRVHPAEQRRADRPADVARERPAEDHEDDDGRDPDRQVEGRAEELAPVAVDHDRRGEDGEQEHELDARAFDGACAQLPCEADFLPVVALRVHEALHRSMSHGAPARVAVV
jgi:hypothetical protein